MLDVILKALALWCCILVLAVLNGVLREALLIPVLGNVAAFVASGIILSVCIFGVAMAATPWYGPLAPRRWLWIGALWLLLTLAFEFALGVLVQHKSWPEVFAAYTFEAGNLWPLVLLVTFVSPWLAARVRGRV